MELYEVFKFVMNGLLLSSAVLHIPLLIFNPQLGRLSWSLALASSLVTYFVAFFVVLNKKKRSTTTKWLSLHGVHELMRWNDTQYFVRNLALFMAGYMNVLVLAPVCIYSIYIFVQSAEKLFGKSQSPMGQRIYKVLFQGLNQWLYHQNQVQKAVFYAQFMEVMLGSMLILGLFIGVPVWLPIIFWNFIAGRYKQSPQMQQIFSQLRTKGDKVFASSICPGMIKLAWDQLCLYGYQFANSR